MNETLKGYWPIIISVLSVVVSFVAQWSIQGARISALEDRQDRQGINITGMQNQITSLANDVSGMKADIGSIKDNVSYIRTRIDRVTQ